MSERWSGKLVDAAGRVGTIEGDLPEQGDDGKAHWRVLLAERDGEPSVLEGDVELRRTDAGVEMKSRDKLPDGREITWDMNLENADAGTYADASLVGQYRLAVEGGDDKSAPLPLTRGLLVLWRFK
jgi:hypothetical protein